MKCNLLKGVNYQKTKCKKQKICNEFLHLQVVEYVKTNQVIFANMACVIKLRLLQINISFVSIEFANHTCKLHYRNLYLIDANGVYAVHSQYRRKVYGTTPKGIRIIL